MPRRAADSATEAANELCKQLELRCLPWALCKAQVFVRLCPKTFGGCADSSKGAGPFEVANGNLWIFASCKFHVFPNFFVWDHQFPIERISRIESGHCRGIYTYLHAYGRCQVKFTRHNMHIYEHWGYSLVPCQTSTLWSLVSVAALYTTEKEPLTPWPLDSKPQFFQEFPSLKN